MCSEPARTVHRKALKSRLARAADQLSLSAARKQRLSLSESRTWRIRHCQLWPAEYKTVEITTTNNTHHHHGHGRGEDRAGEQGVVERVSKVLLGG